MKRTHTFSSLTFAAVFALVSQFPLTAMPGMDSPLRAMSPQYEAEAARLRSAAPQQFDFSKALLSDVLRFLATDAGISFFSLPDDSEEGTRMVTFSINASPFQVLETLCKSNALALIPDNGIWYIRPADDKELLGKAYEIKHNALERLEKIGGGGATTSSSSAGGGASAGINLQGGTETFKALPSEIITDIRAILDLENQTGAAGAAAGPLGGAGGGGDVAVQASNSNELSAHRKPKIIWKSDSNTLYVVATRLQHMWVEGYLAASDKPQPMIGIEVKFIETSRDPKKEFGIDWSGTLGQNGTFRQSSKLNVTPATYLKDAGGLPLLDAEGNQIVDSPASYTVDYNSIPNASGGYRADLSDMFELENIRHIGSMFNTPALGLLSAQDVSFKLRAFMNDEDTKTTSYPRMVTLNNREVAFRSVRNQPVLGSSSSSSIGGGATSTSSVEYLPIGTVLNILPKKMENNKVLLNMSVTVSSIVGQEIIAGNPYPVASSRVYNAPVEMESGYTVAVGGLNEATERVSEAGVPVLGKIPVFGWLFKHKGKSKNQKDLMVFITPTLINAREGGLPEEPQSVIPQRGPGTNPTMPKIDGGTGALLGGPDAVRESVEYMKRESDIIRRTIDEKRATEADSKKLAELKTAVTHLDGQVGSFEQTYPHRAAEMAGYRQELKAIHNSIWKMQREMFARKFF
jgi:type II secretory pathway component GspD/PulD (secretin)